MQEIAQKVKGLPRKENLIAAYEEFRKYYPELILENPIWSFNCVGGAFAEILIIYCSLNEYVVLWGSPLETMGHSGYYPKLDIYDVMLSGEMYSHLPGNKVDTFRVSDVSLLKKGQRRYWRLSENNGEGTYMIDYARGSIPSLYKDLFIIGHRRITGDWKSIREHVFEIHRSFSQHWNKNQIKEKYRKENPDFIG